VSRSKSDAAIASSLLFAIFLWGGNNAGTRHIVTHWPPVWTGGTRFALAGLLLLALLRWTTWFGKPTRLDPQMSRRLWWRGGLSLAVYIVSFNWALRYTSASHVALYLGASPVWALLWEGMPEKSWRTLQRYGAATLALIGVLVLFRPALQAGTGANWIGESFGLAASVLWTNYGRQVRALGASLSGVEVSAHTMWRAGLLLLPIGIAEAIRHPPELRTDLILIQVYCIVAGGVAAFGMWNNALRHWATSRVLLVNNMIPLSTMTWSHFCLGEPVTTTFWLAMVLIVSGVILGQTNWQRFLPASNVPPE